MSIELTRTPLLSPSQIGELASSLDAIHGRALKTIERLNKDVAARKSEISNRWKNSGVSMQDQARYAESETLASVRQIRDNAQKELDAILKSAGSPHEQLVAQRQFYDSPVKVLARAGLGSPERTHYATQLDHAGPSELAHMAQVAVSTKNESLAAAVLGLLDRLPTKDRSVSPQHLANSMRLDAYLKVQEYIKLGDARLQGILVAIRTWKQGRANPLDTVALALRERAIGLGGLRRRGRAGRLPVLPRARPVRAEGREGSGRRPALQRGPPGPMLTEQRLGHWPGVTRTTPTTCRAKRPEAAHGAPEMGPHSLPVCPYRARDVGQRSETPSYMSACAEPRTDSRLVGRRFEGTPGLPNPANRALMPSASPNHWSTEMKLEDMSSKELLVLHNRIADKPAGPKTFSTRAKLVDRIRSIAKAKDLDPDSPGQPKRRKAAAAESRPSAEAAENPKTTGKKRGSGVGELARQMLLHPAGYPHALIAAMINEQIEGARATAKSVRWYACDMRKMGLDVAKRAKVHRANMDAEESAEWLASVKVVEQFSK